MVHVVYLNIKRKIQRKVNMETTQKEPGRTAKIFGFLGLTLCALCCALPVIGIIGGAGVLATVALYAEKVAVILLIISSASFGIWFYLRRRPSACSVDCTCKTEQASSDGVEG